MITFIVGTPLWVHSLLSTAPPPPFTAIRIVVARRRLEDQTSSSSLREESESERGDRLERPGPKSGSINIFTHGGPPPPLEVYTPCGWHFHYIGGCPMTIVTSMIIERTDKRSMHCTYTEDLPIKKVNQRRFTYHDGIKSSIGRIGFTYQYQYGIKSPTIVL